MGFKKAFMYSYICEIEKGLIEKWSGNQISEQQDEIVT